MNMLASANIISQIAVAITISTRISRTLSVISALLSKRGVRGGSITDPRPGVTRKSADLRDQRHSKIAGDRLAAVCRCTGDQAAAAGCGSATTIIRRKPSPYSPATNTPGTIALGHSCESKLQALAGGDEQRWKRRWKRGQDPIWQDRALADGAKSTGMTPWPVARPGKCHVERPQTESEQAAVQRKCYLYCSAGNYLRMVLRPVNGYSFLKLDVQP